MGKGEATRTAVLDHALKVASRVGLEGLTIGALAADLGLSKSGLFAHFQSKEALQIQVLETAAARFVETVLAPALRQPRGEPRLRTLFSNWLEWSERCDLPGGCLFVAAAVELDDREGPVRATLVQTQREWHEALARAVALGVEAGQFRPDLDPAQMAHDLYAVVLGYYHAHRLLRDPQARARADRAFEALLAQARPTL